MELKKDMSSKQENIPQKITVILAMLVLISILAAKEVFTEHVEGLASQLDMTVADTWLIIFVVAIFLVVLITWFFTSIKIEKQ